MPRRPPHWVGFILNVRAFWGRHHSGDPGVTLAIAPGMTLAITAPHRTLTLAIHTASPKRGFELRWLGALLQGFPP